MGCGVVMAVRLENEDAVGTRIQVKRVLDGTILGKMGIAE